MKEEVRYFCLECLGTAFCISALELKDGTEAWIHMCSTCNIRMGWGRASGGESAGVSGAGSECVEGVCRFCSGGIWSS